MKLTKGEVKQLVKFADQLQLRLLQHQSTIPGGCSSCERLLEDSKKFLTVITKKVYTPSHRSDN